MLLQDVMKEGMLLDRQYHQKLEVGKAVSTLLYTNEHLSDQSLTCKYETALKLYRQAQVQHVYEYAMLR